MAAAFLLDSLWLLEQASDYITTPTCSTRGVQALASTLRFLSLEISLLKDFACINLEAFGKITKKFDKKTKRHYAAGLTSTFLQRAAISDTQQIVDLAALVESSLSEISLFTSARRTPRTSTLSSAVFKRSIRQRLETAVAEDDMRSLKYVFLSILSNNALPTFAFM